MHLLRMVPGPFWLGLVFVGLALWADDIRGLYIAGAFLAAGVVMGFANDTDE